MFFCCSAWHEPSTRYQTRYVGLRFSTWLEHDSCTICLINNQMCQRYDLFESCKEKKKWLLNLILMDWPKHYFLAWFWKYLKLYFILWWFAFSRSSEVTICHLTPAPQAITWMKNNLQCHLQWNCIFHPLVAEKWLVYIVKRMLALVD